MTATKIWILVKQLNVTKPNMELWSIYQWIIFWFAFRKWKMSDPSDDRGDQCVVFFISTFHDFRILSNDVNIFLFFSSFNMIKTSLVIEEMIT
jgi:hypothetical protein